MDEFDKEDFEGAIADYSSSIRLFPGDAETYYYRALAKFEMGNNYDACLDLNAASELGLEEATKSIKKNCK